MTLYATDLDGTLLNQNAVISENSVRILNGLLDKGLMLTVASGRSPVTGLKLLEALHLCLPVALLNGGLIYDPAERKAVGCLTFSPEARSILAKAEEETNFGGFAITMRQGKILLHAGKPDDPRGYREWMAAGVPYDNCPIRDIPVEEELFCAYYTSYDEAHIRAFYEKICCCQDIRVGLYRNDYEPEKWCIEVNHRDASKASAVLRIREMTGADRLVVFGDAENDIPMFEVSDEAYATADACEKLKGLATDVIGHHNEECVAKWLQRHCGLSDRAGVEKNLQYGGVL